MNLQRLIIRHITPFVWRLFPNRKLSALRRFSVVEKDSACRFLQYVPLIEDPKTQAEVFRHALEEFHHSVLFDGLAKSIDQSHVATPVLTRRFIVTEKSSREELIDAYAYAYVGESAVNQNFEAYGSDRMEPTLRKTFRRIAEDEARHAESTDGILLHLCNADMKSYRRYYRRAKQRRWYEEYKTFMNHIGEFQLNTLLRVIYLLVGPLSLLTLRDRLKLKSSDELNVFKQQISEVENFKP